MVAHAVVGQRTKRIDSPPKLTGQERFTADLKLPGLLHARPVGSPYAHARINGIDAAAALAIPGVVAVLTAKDLPIAKDENGKPVAAPLADGEAVHAGQAVALVLAESDAAAQDGVDAVEVDYEPMPVVVGLDQALDPATARVRETEAVGAHDDGGAHNADAAQHTESATAPSAPNVSDQLHFQRGDLDRGFAEADAIVELSFDSLTVHQGYLETQACLVNVEPLGNLTVYTSTQGAFSGRTRVADMLGIPVHRVNVVTMPVGGGFGGKFVLIEPLVAAAAVAVGRPVLLQYSRMEDFLAGNPAPDCKISVKLGGKRDGTITALQANLVFDAGAAKGSPLQISAITLGCYYRVDNLDIVGTEVTTHKPSSGAYRAPGAQQGTFAIESAMDELARKLDLDPMAFRIQNACVEGDLRPNGNEWPKIGLKQCLEALQAHPAWQNREQARAQGRGVGIAVGGWPGGIEPASAVCRLDADGTLTVILGSSDLNGTNTSFAQIAAEGLGVGLDKIQVNTASTDNAPFAGGSGGSKITYTVGAAVQKAASDAREQIMAIAAQHLEAAVEDLEVAEGVVRVKGVPSSGVSLQEIAGMSMSFGGKYEPVYGRGASAITQSAPGFAAHLAEVEVDDVTGETRVVRYVAVQDVGYAINPSAVEGQIHGGVAQGIGWALYEGMAYDDDGQLLTATLMDYTLPRSHMIPPIETVLVEVASDAGPYGAKGVGEPPAIPGPATIANAIRDIAGVRVTSIPIKPPVLAEAIWAANGGGSVPIR